MDSWIVAAGEIRSEEFWRQSLQGAEFIVAANGGSRHLANLNIQPTMVVGDLDSLPPEAAEWPSQPHPIDKDCSDAQLAIDYCSAQGANRLFLLGGLGGRIDHTVANFKLLNCYPGRLFLVDGDFEAVAITTSQTFAAEPNQLISLFPAGVERARLTATGLKFPLTQSWLRPDSHGLSNVAIAPQISLTVHEGVVIAIRSWQPGSNRQPTKP